MAAPSAVFVMAAVAYGFLYGAHASKCYYCNQIEWSPEDDPACMDPFKFLPKHKNDCGSELASLKVAEGCLKYFVRKDSGAQHFARLCPSSSLTFKKDACMETIVRGRKVTVCHCSTDYCNSSPTAWEARPGALMVAVATSLIAAAFAKAVHL